MQQLETTWDFVEKYYPNYYGCDEIAYNDDLSKLVNQEQEEKDDADQMLKSTYGNDINNPKILIDFNESLVRIYEKAIEGYLEKLKNNTLKK